MSERIHGLAQLLPDKNFLEDCSTEELQHITKRFPYFAPAQFLLLQKLKETGSPDYEAQQQKAVLYFHDPLLFRYFISPEDFLLNEADLTGEKNTEVTHHHLVDNEPLSASEASLPAGAINNSEEKPEVEHTTEVAPSPQEEQKKNVVPPAIASITEASLPAEPDKVLEPDGVEVAEPAVLPVSPLQEHLLPLNGPEETANAESSVPETKELIVAPPSSVVPIGVKSMMTTESKGENKDLTVTAGDSLLFEPFHTVDYFASQGIKITSEGLPKDKLSRQLRSFTEWLRIMKRLPAAEAEATPQTNAEKTVENLATHSVKGSDVVTEAMAEVWARQGNKPKAIETYNKLSLLNPSKKAYFAAKIENLSGT